MSFEVLGRTMNNVNDMPSGFVVCVDNHEYPASLELHKIYRSIPDEDAAVDGDLRVIDESGEDYLYSASSFLPIRLPGETERALADSFSRHRVETV